MFKDSKSKIRNREKTWKLEICSFRSFCVFKIKLLLVISFQFIYRCRVLEISEKLNNKLHALGLKIQTVFLNSCTEKNFSTGKSISKYDFWFTLLFPINFV